MSKKLKLSQWHDENVKPVHVGFYNVICTDIWDGESWSFWNGSRWSPQCCGGIELAKNLIYSEAFEDQNKKWRGIVK